MRNFQGGVEKFSGGGGGLKIFFLGGGLRNFRGVNIISGGLGISLRGRVEIFFEWGWEFFGRPG